jgi:hypothetical protein
MRDFHAFILENWPRRKRGDLIFTSTEEAFYYAYIVEDRVSAYDLLKKWRKNAYLDLAKAKLQTPVNYNRVFDLAVRAQFYREAMEEIERLNMEGL